MMVHSEVILPRINKLDNCKKIRKQVSCKHPTTGFSNGISPTIPTCSSSLYHLKSAQFKLPEVCDNEKKALERKSMGEVNSNSFNKEKKALERKSAGKVNSKSSNKELKSRSKGFISAKSANSVNKCTSAGLPTLKSKGLIHSKLLEPKYYAKNIIVSQQVNLVCKGSNTTKTNPKGNKDITGEGATNHSSTDSICTDPSALKLKLPSNIHRLQSGADCCSVINLRIPLPNLANGKHSLDCQESTGEAKPRQRRKSSICTNVRGSSNDAMQVKCNAWEKNNHCEEVKGKTINPININNDIAVALEKLIASSESTLMDRNNSYSVDARTKKHLSIVDFHKQSSEFSTHNPLYQPPQSSSSNSSDSSDVPSIRCSPRISHRVSLPMGFVAGMSTQSDSPHLSVKDCIFNLSKQNSGSALSGEGHHWKQLPPPPMASRLSLIRRNSNGNTGTKNLINSLQGTPQSLHHSTSNCTAGLIVEGAAEKVEKKMTELPPLVKNGSPSLHTKTLNESDNSLQINPARLYTNETPRTLKGHIQKEKKPERMSISLSEYSYSDPLSGGAYGFQRRISELQEYEHGTIRKERKKFKKATQNSLKR